MNINTVISDTLSAVADFLMTEPISYFVGICLLFFVAALARYIMWGKGGSR